MIEALNEPSRRTEAAELIRALVDRIVFSPGNPKRAALDLHGDLAGILGLVLETGGKPPVTTMVAGARNWLNLLLVAWAAPRVQSRA